MSEKVSVILPVYNRPDSLVDACVSVLNQSYRNLELIVVDDASTEDLASAVEGLDDPRLRYIRHDENGGAAAARNTGLEVAEGSLIAFQDSDDLWLPGKLARQVALLNSLPEEIGVVTGGKIAYGADGIGNYGPGLVTYAPHPNRLLKVEDDQVEITLTENRISLQNALFRRDCYPEPLWFDPKAKANNDWEFTIRLVQHTKVYEDYEPVILAFSSSESISGNPRKKITGHLLVLKKNRHLSQRYRRQYGRSLYTLGRGLWKIGKRRAGRRFMLQGIRDCPDVLVYLVRTTLKRILKRGR